MLPNFIGIGANRAGTTWLYRNLSEHPDIFVPHEKELHFFDLDHNFEQGIRLYEEYFVPWSGEAAAGEITPRYLHHELSAQRIYSMLPEVRLICCLRDPVARAYSQYWRSEAMAGSEPSISFEEKLERHPDIIRTGFYYDHMRRYFDLFPSSHIHVYLFDEIESNPRQVIRNVYDFLGVDNTFVPPYLDHKINSGAALGNLARSRLLSYLRRAAKRLGPSASVVEKRIEDVNSRSLPPMRPETADYLRSLYRDQIEQLAELLDRDLTIWLQETKSELYTT